MTAWLLSKRFVSFPALYCHSKLIVFISTLGLNNEGKRCQAKELEKSIKAKLLKGILRVD